MSICLAKTQGDMGINIESTSDMYGAYINSGNDWTSF